MSKIIQGDGFMDKNYNSTSNNVSQESDMQVFVEKTKIFVLESAVKIKNFVLPKMIKLFYKLSILKDIDEELSYDEHRDNEYTLKIINASNHSKQIALLDMAVFTSPELQDCIINEKTLREMVIEFQVIKSKLFIENRSTKGNFIYEGSLVEEIVKNTTDMSPVLKKVYVDFFKDEVYQYHCSSILEISFDDLYDEKWMSKICEKLSNYYDEEIMNSDYPREVINKFKFIYMLIKIQEIKYDALTKVKYQ